MTTEEYLRELEALNRRLRFIHKITWAVLVLVMISFVLRMIAMFQ